MNGKPFTEFEDNQLRRLHNNGATVGYMAFQLNRPYGSICTRRRHLGLSYRPGEPRGPHNKQETPAPKQTTEVKKVDDFDANGIIVLGLFIVVALTYGAWMTAGSGL